MSTSNDPNQTPEQPETPQQPEAPEAPQAPQPNTDDQATRAFEQPAQPVPPTQAFAQQPEQPYAQPQPPQGQPPQGQPPYGAQQPGYPAARPPMNALALVSFIGSFFISLVGIICGHIALGQIKKTGDRGRGFALAGTIIGYVALAFTILGIILSLVFTGLFINAANDNLRNLETTLEEVDEYDFDDVAASAAADAAADISAEGAANAAAEGAAGSSANGTETETTTPSGDRSPEFCAALIEVSEMGNTVDANGGIDEATMRAFAKLAETSSPNQQAYQDFYAFIQDPLGGGDFSSVFDNYMDAVLQDAPACM